MHAVSKIEASAAHTPEAYSDHCVGFRRAGYVDREMGSVHMGMGISFLDASGAVKTHLHSFEETFYVLDGNLIVQIGDKAYEVGPGNFGLIATSTPHGFRNAADTSACWLEMQAPQPRPLTYGRDTFFPGS